MPLHVISDSEPSNGAARRPRDIDPGVVLLIQEVRRGNDALRSEMVSAQRETTAAIDRMGEKIDRLQEQAPGRLAFYLAAGVVILALVSMFGVLATKGVDPKGVADAVRVVAPSSAPDAPTSAPGAPQPGVAAPAPVDPGTGP